ncbi:MAG: 2-amino-4-hydroxy-6-hydroxymethyldihydropteridine diphosphokinase [Bacteroidales bacterium]|nr:2-amino-4-hydroxy-6-hydroxymethyldihydropteridine diphosphokinase [Bacteroidales bacterium]
MKPLFLSLGSNVGDRYAYLSEASRRIANRVGTVKSFSSIYESEPWGYSSQNLFYNQVLEVSCNIEVFHLLSIIQLIEEELGRKRAVSEYSDRTLDIDILFYGQDIINSSQLTVPHQHIVNRRFVLEPLCEIAPDFIHPVFKINIAQLLEQCEDKLTVKRIKI